MPEGDYSYRENTRYSKIVIASNIVLFEQFPIVMDAVLGTDALVSRRLPVNLNGILPHDPGTPSYIRFSTLRKELPRRSDTQPVQFMTLLYTDRGQRRIASVSSDHTDRTVMTNIPAYLKRLYPSGQLPKTATIKMRPNADIELYATHYDEDEGITTTLEPLTITSILGQDRQLTFHEVTALAAAGICARLLLLAS